MSDIYFYKYIVNKQVFFRSKHCYALVNLKPLIQGHVLLVPYNPEIYRFNQLSDEESIDYMRSLQTLSRFLTWNYKADALNIAIQDGPESGQSVPHLHTHLIPRFKTDDLKNDRVHQQLSKVDILTDFEARRLAYTQKPTRVRDDSQRVARTDDEMEQEANELKRKFEEFSQLNPHQ
ncbi:Dinucleoside triphosphate hydrolase [Yamadazyma tenuis]|uniref:Bis(5'-adenosyl)-triphosphatase n=1 Tax=Candida tenuis (strain ATCC 10573 / BCRC 21748 / CBS 615 / JCM 9827 / NBRC 10315 / NRRL Y-1498 / VKM Y-70) TaxID=590646 RepID=G3B449_CANTC|nr:diadenosine polyphosphate hydrolase [Yamadazyma tenuis ATCC 10573]EGV63776.1 diadenosine polyphosphate hydrolase [Yamadazyma tenuis ATCC 10573]WEJ96612.1 Dinucleoside triphosphate hydrolase [Yamadazyma tenuis]